MKLNYQAGAHFLFLRNTWRSHTHTHTHKPINWADKGFLPRPYQFIIYYHPVLWRYIDCTVDRIAE